MTSSSAATLVLIPGLLSDGIVWKPVADSFSTDLSVYNADVSTLTSLTECAQRFLDDTHGPLVPVGHSMGGRIALEMARLAPDRMQGLVLVDTGVHPRSEGEQITREKMINLGYQGISALYDAWLPPMVAPTRREDTALMTALNQMVLRATAEQHERQMRALLDRPDAVPGLKLLKCPVLILVGREDSWSTVSQHEEIRDHITTASLVVIEDAGHFAPIEKPETVIAALQNWMRENQL